MVYAVNWHRQLSPQSSSKFDAEKGLDVHNTCMTQTPGKLYGGQWKSGAQLMRARAEFHFSAGMTSAW